MAQEMQQWRPSTALSIMQRAELAKTAMALRTSLETAARLGKQLVGQWPHANPPNPGAYSLAIAKTLEKYPLGVVEECCDPVAGLAAVRDFPPTINSIVLWCDMRLKQHQGAIIWGKQEAAAHREEQLFPLAHRQSMLRRLSKLMHGLFDKPQAEAAE
jgi:hypothetical protein